MQKSFEVKSSLGSYLIKIESGAFDTVIDQYPDAIYLVDDYFFERISDKVKKCIAIKAAEKNKSLEEIVPIIEQLRAVGATRDTHLVAVGGGIVQDICTFVASIYMRGITWSYIPTTLLGMSDSCMGGKSSINVGVLKNIVGNFYPPREILIDADFVQTLNVDSIVGGLVEAAKICYAKDSTVFETYLALSPGYPLNVDTAENIISLSLNTKKWFIEVDEFDSAERLLLNYGHTFGHAIESATEYKISHGVAVGLGIKVACHVSASLGFLNTAGLNATTSLTRHMDTLLESLRLTAGHNWPNIAIDNVIDKFGSDKKHKADLFRIILPTSNGELVIHSLPKVVSTINMLREAYKEVLLEAGIGVS